MSLPVLPSFPGLGYPFKRTQGWYSLRQKSVSGQETRFQIWSYPQYSYDIPANVLRTAAALTEYQQLVGFYNSVGGSAQVFLYTDTDDSTAINQGFGTGDGVTTQFQLVRSFGGFVEPVFAVNVLTDIKDNGTPTSSYSINATGLITFNSAPLNGHALTWDGTFYWACRFDEDQLESTKLIGGIYQTQSIKFTTIKLSS